MPKQEKEFFLSDNIDWNESSICENERTLLYKTKILTEDKITGDKTLILYFLPNYLSGKHIITHDYWEEVYILDGELKDITLRKTFKKDYYACRPPSMKHGPYEVGMKGCKMLVTIKYNN
ncbi:hypothetical protein K492DRAFT_139312 [Lichtheimia hyalospora FSU 10163]|nr:hypothetical protein K492DRAFT_139312 [Lichtheimia hyalospora FSU 10163]